VYRELKNAYDAGKLSGKYVCGMRAVAVEPFFGKFVNFDRSMKI
jgi:hypothetical protein